MKDKTLKTLTILGAVLGLANPLIAFAAVKFDIEGSLADPNLFLRAVSTGPWIFLGMPLFFLTDSLGWYVFPSFLIRRLLERYSLPNASRIRTLTWIYSIIGNLGVLVFIVGYYAYIAGAVDVDFFIRASRMSYDWIWGTINNLFGGSMFVLLALGLFRKVKKIVPGVNFFVGVVMLLSSILFLVGTLAGIPSISDISSAYTIPLYLLLFPVAVLLYWPLWSKE
ncbi:MAG: hypothetical protein PVF83_14485 [Anaerolineales bacterium]